jgi:hypothetical protein
MVDGNAPGFAALYPGYTIPATPPTRSPGFRLWLYPGYLTTSLAVAGHHCIGNFNPCSRAHAFAVS